MKAAGPAVVNVISTRKAQTAAAGGGAANGAAQDPMAEFFRRFLPDLPDRAQPRQGLGSGFIISEDGYILTNAHVVADFDDVNVRLADAKREFKAKVIGVDKRSDVALLKVDAQGLPTAKLGSSAGLEPGDWVAAIGSPFGFANTITAGIGIQPMTAELARSFGLESTAGAIIVNLEAGGPADKAGAHIGDVVLEWNGEAIDEPNELPRRV